MMVRKSTFDKKKHYKLFLTAPHSCIVHHQVRSSILILIFNQGYKNVDKQSHPVSQVFRLSNSINLSTSWQNALLILEAHQSVYAVANSTYLQYIH